jgi:phytoene desaturase
MSHDVSSLFPYGKIWVDKGVHTLKKVIVIGAGVAGLSAAIRLQSKGFQVHIYEKNDRVGGRMHQFKDQGFTFDYGPTITMLPDEYRDVFLSSGAHPDDYIDMMPLNPLYTLYFPNQKPFTVSSYLPELMKTLESFGENEAHGYLNYIQDVYERYVRAKNHFLNKSYRKPLDFYNLKTLYHGLKLRTLGNAYKSISKFVKSDVLRQALSFQTLYIGVSPFQGPSIYTIIPMIELLYGIHYIKGGMYQMAVAMERRFKELGGTIHLNENVEEIILEGNFGKGIIASGKKIDADIVLTNADFPWAVKHLIKEDKKRGKYNNKKLKKMSYSSSVMIMYLGLDKKYPRDVHSLKFASSFKKNIRDLFENQVPEDPSFYMYSPSQIDPQMAPEGKDVLYVLVPVPNTKGDDPWDETYTKAYANKVLDMMTKLDGLSDLKDHIEVMHISNPRDWEKKFHLNHGATFGLRTTLSQSLYFRPQATLKPLKNVYFTGSSTHPGPGVPIVLQAAKLAVSDILKDHPNA